MKSTLLAGLWPMSVSFPITLTQRNMQVSQVVMNALSDTWPFSLHAARLLCSLCCILSVSSLFKPGIPSSLYWETSCSLNVSRISL